MSSMPRIVTVTADNVEEEGFFCCKSKPKSDGYRAKLEWLQQRFAEGLVIKVLYDGRRSFGFIEYMPGEFTWRVVEAPEALVIHCLWVVGSGKGQGFGTLLLQECLADAAAQGKSGVVMVSSRGNWLAHEKLFLKNEFTEIDAAPPSFKLLWRPLREGAKPSFPTDWEARAAAFGLGATILYTDQCPYMPDALQEALDAFAARGIPARGLQFRTAEEVRRLSPSPYGVFGLVLDGRLFAYHYLGKAELRRLDERA
jgi:GNAT superfamily N-acetyltransferase